MMGWRDNLLAAEDIIAFLSAELENAVYPISVRHKN
jgi:hypothetical protein